MLPLTVSIMSFASFPLAIQLLSSLPLSLCLVQFASCPLSFTLYLLPFAYYHLPLAL